MQNKNGDREYGMGCKRYRRSASWRRAAIRANLSTERYQTIKYSCKPVTMSGNTIATIYQQTLFHSAKDRKCLFCVHMSIKPAHKNTSGIAVTQNISQACRVPLLLLIPTIVNTTRSRMTPIEITTLASKACQGENRNGARSRTRKCDPHSGHRLLDGFLSWYPQVGQGPMKSFRNASSRIFLRSFIDIV